MFFTFLKYLHLSPFSGCYLHWYGNQDGSQLPVQVSEAVRSGKVSSLALIFMYCMGNKLFLE